jgi:hypothetical protein
VRLSGEEEVKFGDRLSDCLMPPESAAVLQSLSSFLRVQLSWICLAGGTCVNITNAKSDCRELCGRLRGIKRKSQGFRY